MPGTLRRFAPAAALLSAAAVAGCGLGAGPGTGDVTLTVTRDFGARRVEVRRSAKVPGSETVMRLLQRTQKVSTRYGGGFVQSIDGLSGSDRRDWFFYVNGREAPIGAAATAIHRGDRIWWDLHDWTLTDTIPAVVGQFPEPFLHGLDGRRPSTTVLCAPGDRLACDTVARRLRAVGVPVRQGAPSKGGLTVSVGPWSALRSRVLTSSLTAGPRSSGVYVRFDSGGRQLSVLDPRGAVIANLAAGTGLIAATAPPAGGNPEWVITGTDPAGVERAAQGLTEARLAGRFALILTAAGDLSAPADPGR